MNPTVKYPLVKKVRKYKPLNEVYMVSWSDPRKFQLFWDLECACGFAESVDGELYAGAPLDNGQYVRTRKISLTLKTH